MSVTRFGALALSAALITGTAAQAQTAPGEQAFKARCQACHTVKVGGPAILAPSLIGVVGRKAATAKFNYSPALKASKLVWTKDTLDKFLTGPSKLVPGTRMVINVGDPAQRAAIIAYLSTVK